VSNQGPSEGAPGQTGASRRPGARGGGPPQRPPGAIQPLRAVLVLLVAVLVAVVVLARLGGTHSNAAPPNRTTSTTSSTPPSRTIASTSTTVVGTSTTTTTTIPTSSVLVLVLNGWTTSHAALFFKNKLATFGYDLRVPIDAVTSNNKTSRVYYVHPQYEATALAIAGDLDLPATDVVAVSSTDAALTSTDIESAYVILLVGEDISGRVPAGYNGTTATT
jgi:hypothetical protein